jgi:isopenicillin N synthase-like dioxygenase
MYKKSGETLFGLDRKAGDIENLGSEGKEFFRIIDDEKKKLGMSDFCNKWTYNYRGGELEEKLKDLAAKIMFQQYEKNMSNYVKDPETKKRIEGNEGLLLHMSYATWNGPGHFQKFAKILETAVKEGKSDEELLDIAKDSRTDTFTGYWAKANAKVNNLIDKTAGLA